MRLSEIYEEVVKRVWERIREYYGERLFSVVLFGSVARGTPRPDSDLDLLIVAEPLPRGRVKRVREFISGVEEPLEPYLRELAKKGIHPELSPVIKTREEVLCGSPLFLDMIYHRRILYDREGFMERYLSRLAERLKRLGAKRIKRGNAWYWVLKPDYRYPEVIEV
ncbi:nucleotidyltransferase domain-containing protein [Thermosulfurimonas sp.]|uniref:nucleotidyltransferase domain-containing protein n=1 Tax=Thermosulfurimonas sp. TaxID=2080236 RepID=UPI0025D22AA6|nr:nucleotidyltransferase domain-containing protein [Thermosulfurimonas sp.]